MDLITGNVRKLYRKYLTTSMASALAISIFSFVDTIAVGQSEGPVGSAAMAVIIPFFGILVFISSLCGVGGAVLLGNARGEGKEEKGNAYFTAAVVLIITILLLVWGAFALFHNRIFTLFGADAALMPKVMEYAKWMIWTFPVFVAPIFISAFVRNDGAPELSMASVIIGGGFNIFGDWFFVFPLGMGMEGAAIATVLGNVVQVLVLLTHFFRKRCRLRLVRPHQMGAAFRRILTIGFGASIINLGTVVIGILMNNQIMRYGDATHLAVYGMLATIMDLFQMAFGGVGQAIQPIVSANCGAKQPDRIRRVWKLALRTVLVMGVFFTALGELFPQQLARLFMDVTPEVLQAAPGIVRPFFTMFLFVGFTILTIYYLQSNLHGSLSMLIAILRSIVLSSLTILLLPALFGVTGIWIALPVTDLIAAAIALFCARKHVSA